MMKSFRHFLLPLAALAATISLYAQSEESGHTAKLTEEFKSQTEKWKDAYNSGDAQNLLPLYAEDASYVSSHVAGLEAIGRDKLISNFQNGISMGGHIDSIEILSAETSCDMATLYCRYQATNSGMAVEGRNLLVLRKINGEWLIVLHMTVV